MYMELYAIFYASKYLVLRKGTSSQVTTLIHRLETSNEELHKINEKLEPLIPEAEFEAEYGEAVTMRRQP